MYFIFFLISCLLAYVNPNLTNFQKQATGMKGRAMLTLISQDFSILLISSRFLHEESPGLQLKTGCLKTEMPE